MQACPSSCKCFTRHAIILYCFVLTCINTVYLKSSLGSSDTLVFSFRGSLPPVKAFSRGFFAGARVCLGRRGRRRGSARVPPLARGRTRSRVASASESTTGITAIYGAFQPSQRFDPTPRHRNDILSWFFRGRALRPPVPRAPSS